jgi:hypothetical protein
MERVNLTKINCKHFFLSIITLLFWQKLQYNE